MKHVNQKIPGYIAATVSSVIFGFSFLFSKKALEHLEVFQMLGIRFLLAAACMLLLAAFGVIKIKLNGKKLKQILAVAFFEPFLYFICETYGIKMTSASESGIMIGLIPIAVAVFSIFILKESVSAKQWGGIVAAVAGVALITLAKGFAEGGTHFLGYFILLGAVVSAGLFNPLSRRASAECTPVEITFVMIMMGTVVFNGIGLFTAGFEGRLGRYLTDALQLNVLSSLLYLSVLSSVVAFFCMNYSVSKIKASVSAGFVNLTTVISVFAGVFINGEKLYWLQLAGAVLVLVGIWCVTKTNSGGINKDECIKQEEETLSL